MIGKSWDWRISISACWFRDIVGEWEKRDMASDQPERIDEEFKVGGKSDFFRAI